MARRRMIDPKFWSDKHFFLQIFCACSDLFPSKSKKFLYRLSRNVRLFYSGMWSYADDLGRFLNDYVKLKAEIFPFDEDIVKSDIKIFIKVLEKAKKVYLYDISSVTFGVLLNFLKHQKINRPTPSDLPAPPEPKFTEWLKSNSIATPERLSLARAEVEVKKAKLSKEEVKRAHAREGEEGAKTFFPSSSQNQNQKPIYEPGPAYCSGCHKSMADEGDKWFCPDCQIRKDKKLAYPTKKT